MAYVNSNIATVQHSAVVCVVVLGKFYHCIEQYLAHAPLAGDSRMCSKLIRLRISFLSLLPHRNSMIEMQAILIELIENLEFSPPPGNIEIIRGATALMTPM